MAISLGILPPRSAGFPAAGMLRTQDWKLLHYVRTLCRGLCNPREDPHELGNPYAGPGCAETRAERKSQPAGWLIETEDPAQPPVRADA